MEEFSELWVGEKMVETMVALDTVQERQARKGKEFLLLKLYQKKKRLLQESNKYSRKPEYLNPKSIILLLCYQEVLEYLFL